jgi:hypothetical protein
MSLIINDGTGSGYKAKVGDNNRLYVEAITEDTYVAAAEEGRAFNINTEAVAVTGTGPFTKDLLYVKNNETADLEIVGWFIGEKNDRSGGSTTEPLLFEMYGSPSGTAAGTVITPVNRRIGSPREFDIDARSLPTGLSLSVTTPLLYQYHYGSRAFGTVNFTIPSGASILLRVNSETDSFTLYTGFTGYVKG